MAESKVLLEITGLRPYEEKCQDIYGPHGLDMKINVGEFLVVLGKSGYGKTTLIELLLGTRPKVENSRSKIILYNKGEPQELKQGCELGKRQFGVLFQDLALFESRTVEQNLQFVLKIHGVPREQWRSRINAQLENVQLTPKDFLGRKPDENMSGGERQRVALARLMIVERRLYLFDEPLSNIDNPLRQEVVKRLLVLRNALAEKRAAAIYVTHNQAEALSLASKILILRKNVGIEQEGCPEDIYNKPKTRYIAEFVGDPLYNLVPVVSAGDGVIRLDGSRLQETPAPSLPKLWIQRRGGERSPFSMKDLEGIIVEAGNRVLLGNSEIRHRFALGFRPEALQLPSASCLQEACLVLNLTPQAKMFQGEEVVYYAKEKESNNEVQVQSEVDVAEKITLGRAQDFVVPLDKLSVFNFPWGVSFRTYDDNNTGNNITHHPISNCFGHIIYPPLDGFFHKKVGPVIQRSLRNLFTYLMGTDSESDRLLHIFLEMVSKADCADKLEKEGHEKFLDQENLHKKIESRLGDRARIILDQIRGEIAGNSVLDLGCGDGIIGYSLRKVIKDVRFADVHNYLDKKISRKLFKQVQEREPLVFKRNFDSILLLTVLHHSEDPIALLREVRRIAEQRLIVIESVFGVNASAHAFSQCDPRITEEFLSLSRDEQLMFISFFDWFYNRILHKDVPVTFNFNSSDAWKPLFEDMGFKVSKIVHLGIDQPLVPEYHILYVLDTMKH